MTLPWEGVVLPWETMPFTRTVDIHRIKTVATATTTGTGNTGYSGMEQANDAEGEAVLFVDLRATIMAKAPGRTRGDMLPADIVYKPMWDILIPSSQIKQYSIRDRDIIIDDEGYRYAVATNTWTPDGYALNCVRLEI